MTTNQILGDLVRDIIASPGFDLDFIREHYCVADASEISANQILGNVNSIGLVPFCKEFHPVSYLSNNLDVLFANMNPLAHWVRFGRDEHRKSQDVKSNYYDANDNISLRELSGTLPAFGARFPRTALTIHIFYDEYIPWIVALLKNCPTDIDLFVTSPERSFIRDFQNAMKAARCSHKCRCAISPNRGRNFGPMLVEFSKELRQYDVVGHIHTKKSAYTGTPRYDWWLHAISGVLTGPQHINFIRKLLSQENSPYGLVCAEKLPELPFWAYHDLQNSSIINHLSSLLGRISGQSSGFSDYPVGGMFWASNRVLRKLLAREWSYSDFPEEMGQTDGTMQHAIERIIGYLAADNGLKTLKWVPNEHVYNINSKPWCLEIQRSVRAESARAAIEASDTVSFDIFDTLLYRSTLDLERARRIVDDEHPGYLDARVRAESQCRAMLSMYQDVNVADIAQAMATDNAFTLKQAFYLMNREFEVDLAFMRKRSSVCSLVAYARNKGKRIIFVSDMYLSSLAISIIIDRLHIPKPDKIFVSSDIGRRKDRGDMWDYIKDQSLGKVIHFGDNIVSDLQNASDRGISSYYIPSVIDKVDYLNVFRRRGLCSIKMEPFSSVGEIYGEVAFFD